MSFSKVIIAPRLGCIINTLNGNGAFLYNPKQKNGLLLALNEALNNKNKTSEMGNYNLSLTRKSEWRDIGKKTDKVYDNILK